MFLDPHAYKSHLRQVWAYGYLQHEHARLLEAAETRALAIMPVWTSKS